MYPNVLLLNALVKLEDDRVDAKALVKLAKVAVKLDTVRVKNSVTFRFATVKQATSAFERSQACACS